MGLIAEHLYIIICASCLSVILGTVLGLTAYVFRKSRRVILTITDILQTIPALALLGIIMVAAGPGKRTVIIGITLYSLLPIVRNTYIGLMNIDQGIKEAAKGMGMSRLQRLFQVEIPLAFPTMFTGIRIAVINAVGTAVFAAFVGGGGLGSVLNRGIRLQDMSMVFRGTFVLMTIAVLLDIGMGYAQHHIRKSHGNSRKLVLYAVSVVLIFLIVYPSGVMYGENKEELVLYDGDYTETRLLHSMVKQLIEDHTDLSVTIRDQMSQVNNFKAMVSGKKECDLMASYDGTLLTTFLHIDPEDIPGEISIYDMANQKASEKYNISLLGKIGFDNTYAIAVPQEIADTYRLETISDLIPVADYLVFGAEHEFFTQEGSMKYAPFVQFYGLHFKEHKSVDVSLKYAAVENGEFDVTEVYATDGLNVRAGLKILKDDRKFFPDYNGALLIKNDLFEKFSMQAPELKEVLDKMEGAFSTEEMAQLTYRVDVMREPVDEVAQQALRKKGMIH